VVALVGHGPGHVPVRHHVARGSVLSRVGLASTAMMKTLELVKGSAHIPVSMCVWGGGKVNQKDK
jgi:hypothetical protein